jgi:hypothetical protein
MFTKILSVCLLAIMPTLAVANELPDAPLPKISVEEPKLPVKEYHFNKKVYIAELAVTGAAMSADWITTVHNIYKPGRFETNSLLGHHPSEGKIAAYGAAEFAVAAGMLWVTEHNHHKWVRVAGRLLVADSAINHAQNAVCNARNGNCHDIAIAPGF